nr:RNA polymerase alpha subunit [Chlorogonium euchlorum]
MNKIFISCKESRIENNQSFYGCFYLGPFNESESLTIANALRRTLLSECPGLAIISVIIEDVNHEYSTLSGVRDSVLDILLNLKEIVLKKVKNPWLTYKQKGVSSAYNQVGSSFFKPVVGYLKVKGPGIVRAKDLRLPPFIQCVDPDQYIATLSENGSLNMKFVIMEGKSSIIQKANSFVDYSFVKKRRILLKTLKELMMYPSSLFKLKAGQAITYPTSFGFIKLSGKHYKSFSNRGKDAEKINGLPSGTLSAFKNASPLNIDAIFNPIKKVNYIIEVSENKIVNKNNEKYNLTNNLSTLIESGDFYKTNFPFFGTGTFFLLKNNEINLPLSEEKEDGNFRNASLALTLSEELEIERPYGEQKTATYNLIPLGSKALLTPKESLYMRQNINSEGANNKFNGLLPTKGGLLRADQKKFSQTFMQNLLEYVETYSTDELLNTSRSLHPLRKESVLHTVILEIWTNGSLHPREALSIAFSHLTKLFMNLEKTKVFNPIYKDVSSYKKCLNTNIREASSKERMSGSILSKFNILSASLPFSLPAEGRLKAGLEGELEGGLEGGIERGLESGLEGGKEVQSFGKIRRVVIEGQNIEGKSGLSVPADLNYEKLGRESSQSPILIHTHTHTNTHTHTQAEDLGSQKLGAGPSALAKVKFSSQDLTQVGFQDLPGANLKTMVQKVSNEQDRRKKLDIGTLNLNLRAYTQLKRANIKTIGDLTALSNKNLDEYYKLDKNSIKLINKSLEEFGLSLLKNN